MAVKRGRATPKLNRACMLCAIVQPLNKFRSEGCPNCESVLHFADNDDLIRKCTSSSFEGITAYRGTDESWVSRWLRIDHFVPGIYAVRIAGKIPEDVQGDLSAQGVEYRPRDGSARD